VPIVALSVAYELELAGTIQLLENGGDSAFRDERDETYPFILAGGPLTFSNPVPLAPYADAIIMGEAEGLVTDVIAMIAGSASKGLALRRLADVAHVFVPEHHGEDLPAIAQCDDVLLPAWAPIRHPTPSFRTCHRNRARMLARCAYCVMRRSTNGGMRIVPAERVLACIPDDAQRVGLVGAAVSDHPKIVHIIETLASQGRQVSLSSLRPDRLNDAFVAALKKGGARALTTALDSASERIREQLERRAHVRHLVRAADPPARTGMKRLKLYLMLGLPGETDERRRVRRSRLRALSHRCRSASPFLPQT
jgi:radical SAM superfamily enzyme YgiQ (UPF0313 family)